MNTRNLIPFLLILLSSCGKNDKAKEKIDDSARLEFDKPPLETRGLPKNLFTQLKDTTINELRLRLTPIDEQTYDSLSQLTIETTIPLQNSDPLVVKSKNCQLIQLKDGSIDSLCNKKEASGYHEDFLIKGLWKDKNVLLANFRNWEESDDFLLSLTHKSHQYIGPEYILSSDNNFIFMYSDLSKGGYFTGDFGLAEVDTDSIQKLFYFEPNPFTVTTAKWLKDNSCLISAGMVNITGYELKSKAYYIMTFRKGE
jgi:hypothetical protein